MREILFRGKRTDGKGWICGDLLHPLNPDTQGYYIVPIGCALNRMTEVDTATVGQFTGLTDKNGKRIFEGDIVGNKINNPFFKTTGVVNRHLVIYNNNIASFQLQEMDDKVKMSYGFNEGYTDYKNYEVVGNAHDNHDLLP